MRKAIYDYFDTYVKPIAPLLFIHRENNRWVIELVMKGDEKGIMHNLSNKELVLWMQGFVSSYNYFRSEL